MKLKKTIFLISGLIFLWGTAGGAQRTSGLSSQESVELTIYNSNLGLVKDVREINIPEGNVELKFEDVASAIKPETVHIKSVGDSPSFNVLEQNYEYDLINKNKLLDKYVGKELELITYNEDKTPERKVEAKLLSNNDGPIYKIDGKIHLNYPGYPVLPELPGELIATPSLIWLLESPVKDSRNIEVSYLTENIKWEADYVMVAGEEDEKADFSGWVTINNRSGATYDDASLKLVAGDLNRVTERKSRGRFDVAQTAARGKSFEEESLFEYHLYNLNRKTTLKNNQKKQISLLEAKDVPVTKELLVHSKRNYFRSRSGSQDKEQDVEVFLKFDNSKKSNMGMPIPRGTVRVYKKDSSDSLQFIGEDSIDHIPKDEEITIKTGNAFDVVCERKQTNYEKLYSGHYQTSWEVVVKNHKDKEVSVGIVEPLTGDWEVTRKSHDYEKLDAFNIKFNLEIPADGKEKLTYTVRVKY